MRAMPFMFVFTASIYVSIGMVWGIVMAATGDHILAPAHAHLNLGSRLIDDQSQKRTVAARATAERKTFGHLS